MRLFLLLLCFCAYPKGVAAEGLPCGGIPEAGCCSQERLFYCENDMLKILDCRGRPSCGWRKTGRYDCDTAGHADPNGHHAKLCFIGKDKPPVDLGVPPNTCGGVSVEGCCSGDELRLCRDGALRVINCRSNRFCGWRGVAQAYNCGTEGKADPAGKHPRNCQGAPDSGPLRFPDAAAKSPTAKHTAKSGCSGCTCELSSTTSSNTLAPLALLALFIALRTGRKRR